MVTVDSLLFPSASMSDVFVYIFLVLFITTLWVYVNRHRSFRFLALAMFFPGLFALGMNTYHGSLFRFVSFLLFHPQWSTIYWSIFASISSIVLVTVCCLMNYFIGWGQFCQEKISLSAIHEHNRSLLSGWMRALGEEIGWRSYLLPSLLIHFHPFIALNISGIVWGLYHVPVMILLCRHPECEVQYPIRTVFVQFLSCWISAFIYGWIAIQCQFSMIPPTMIHSVWNIINPMVLGSIYTNTPGWMVGEQWKINGEGLMGCIVSFFAAIMVVKHLS